MIVLDASAVVDVVIGQSTRTWVLDQLRGQAITAPAHQPAEVLSALARLVRAGHLAPAAARDAVDDAAGLTQELVEPSRAHLRRALALQDRVRVLDALYVVVAEELHAPLVTTDRRLARVDLAAEVIAPPA